jgi:hypothetical protein
MGIWGFDYSKGEMVVTRKSPYGLYTLSLAKSAATSRARYMFGGKM